MIIYKQLFESEIGALQLVASESGLCYIGLPGTPEEIVDEFISENFSEAEVKNGGEVIRKAISQLRSYFKGELTMFEIPIDLKISGFYREVLNTVSEIPYGKLLKYGEIAKRLNKPGGAQAVGSANAANPIPIVIPCHRVVASNGLGGYAGGLPLKKKLIAIEQQRTLFNFPA
ncbi:MAG: methylated-DNA--[protein]-cysteine S-methyltransferase [candidate division Zixibacteria bacterium]|nr:methylated-DNA--[protein]-cysteine S-methyltransferase [candidate division Zixibacteria bacterium]